MDGDVQAVKIPQLLSLLSINVFVGVSLIQVNYEAKVICQYLILVVNPVVKD